MTGRRPDSLGIWDLPTHFREVDADLVTLPQHFKQHGYFTQNIGKIYHNWRQSIEGDPDSWSVPATLHYATHGSDLPKVEGELPNNLVETVRCECRDVPDTAYFDGRIAERGVAAITRLAQEKQPFFLAVGFWKPHLPFNPPKKYWDLYNRNEISLPSHPAPPRNAPAIALHDGRELLRSKAELTEEDIRSLRHGYLAGISYLDAQVGKLIDELDRQHLKDNTVIVFWSDHGFHLGEHGLWCKTSNFELDARVPLMIAVPQIQQKGTSTDALVELLDLYPTLVDLCGLPKVATCQGVSLRPLLDDPEAVVKQAAFTQHPRPAYYQGHPEVMGVSARTDRFRYIEWRAFTSGKVVARELYDHQNDPDETNNIAEQFPNNEQSQLVRQALYHQFPNHSR